MPCDIYDQVIDEFIEIFPALVKLGRWMHSGEDDEYTMPPAQMNTLMILSQFPQLNMTQLAEQLYMPRQQLTKIIDALEEKGLVTRKTMPQNRRYVLLELSDNGMEYIRAALGSKRGSFVRFHDAMTVEQRERFSEAVRNIKEILMELTAAQSI